MPQQLSSRLRKDCTLLYEVTKANFKLQNEHSYLGVVWYLLGPLLLFGILVFVFSHRLGESIEQYSLYVFMGIIAWNFFSTGVAKGMVSVVQNAALLKALPIRSEFLVLSAVLQAFLSHGIELLFFFALLLWYGIVPTLFLYFVPVLLLTFVMTFGMALILAVFYVYVRDAHQIWSVITRAWWFATPIFYAPTHTGLGLKLSMFNPLYYVIHLQREILIYGRIPPIHQWIVLCTFSIAFVGIGSMLFAHSKKRFIEYI